MVAKAKGAGQGGCCCGGCRTPPTDPRPGVLEVEKIQQYCCRCIPKNVCVSVVSGDTTTQRLVSRGCSTSPYEGDPIQYTTTVIVEGVSRTINFRFSVRDDLCYLTWDIPALSLDDEMLIDHTVASDPYACSHGMNSASCAEFGGTWEVLSPPLTITISDPPTLDLKDMIECAGCGCICKCMCISIWSQDPEEGLLTRVVSNEIVCGELTRYDVSGCGDSTFQKTPWRANWSSGGWEISIGDQWEHPIHTSTLVSGTESISGTCTVRDATWKGDGLEHSIEGETIEVIYEWSIEHRIAKRFKWVGRSYDETSVVSIQAWNWIGSEWEEIASVAGRPITTTINRAQAELLTSDYTGTGADLGIVRIRLTVTYGTELHTDLILIGVSECCAMELTAPYPIELAETPERIILNADQGCPSPEPLWQVRDVDDVLWTIAASCSWCGGTCGSRSTDCCARPISRILYAEVTIGCATCPNPIGVILNAGVTGVIWEGTTPVIVDCTQLTIELTCGGSSWHIEVQSGACHYSGDSTAVDCDPLSIDFAGTLSGGIGCCPTDPFAVTSISITVIE